MSENIVVIEGIGPKYADLLGRAGINTTHKLLQAGRNRAGRKQLAQQTSINEKNILKWVNMADLFRIRGVAGQFAELLEGAGVDTVKELRTRNAENLAEKMAEVNKQKRLCRVTPGSKTVSNWVAQASKLEPMVTY